MLGSVIKFNAGDISYGSGLASGVNVEDINSAKRFATTTMRNGAKLPLKATAQTVMNNARKAANMQANADLVKQLSEQKLAQVDAGLEMLATAESHSEGMMKREQRFQQIMDKFGRAQLNHRLTTGVHQSESLGHHQAYARGSAFDAL